MTHRIYFAQHGLAVDKKDDPERPLSQRGIQQSKTIAKKLCVSEPPITSVFHSGKLRAAETAEIFARAMNISSTPAIDGLSPNDDVELLAQELNINNALYIGHLPHLDKLVTYLITGNENGSIITFQNSAVVCLEKHDTRYLLQWYLT
ncbi:MAG: phosphohistidine phosphatase SixA, partial [Gammaproteobacteria bacterium]|nr:phosphohistidine phosphatase SixA [Gammaproteobacteria bacterium]